MLNLFENFDTDSLDFLRSQLIADIKIPTVSIHDDGFLPEEVDSPIKFYCGGNNTGKPLYFDKVQFSKYWRIEATARSAEIFDLSKKRAIINFTDVDNTRLVKTVNWLDENGNVLWIDHYNSDGRKFAQTLYKDKRATQKKYLNADGKVVMIQNLILGDIFLDFKGEKKHFSTLNDFIINYLHDQGFNLDHIFYNTLNIPFFLDLKLKTPGNDTLFWHENITDQLPGNMQYLMRNKTRTKHIVFQRYTDWIHSQPFIQNSNNEVDFRYLGMIYPHPRSNGVRKNALILTNSDQIEHLDEILQAMPDIHFNIAALTEMSSKLLAFNKYENVDLFPVVNAQQINKLFDECDIYFDINHADEILNGVRQAFEQNMLIVGFRNTLHNPQFILDNNIFEPNQVKQMRDRVNAALSDSDAMRKQIDLQRKMAGDDTIANYQNTLEVLTDEKFEQ